MNARPDDDQTRSDSGLPDQELTAKDRSYSPSSERETEAKQEESTGDAVRPGTGGPDDVGDVPMPAEDDLDPATIVRRGEPGHRAGDA